MSFSPELLQDWDWSARYPRQEEVQRYLAHVADRFDMRPDIDFGSRVSSATYDEDANIWTVAVEGGAELTCTFLIFATGLLSAAYVPPFDGLEDFAGEVYLTARWPKEPVDLAGKNVALIGTGSSGVQVVPEIAPLVEQLTVFQRTPNYVLPARNHPIDDGQRTAIKRDYEAIWERCRAHFFGFPMDAAGCVGAGMSGPARQRRLEAGWEKGGFRFLFETFADMLSDPETNEAACEFVRGKIRAIVDDPATAEVLCPKGYPLGAKRPPLGHFYYEAFNRPNVALVDVSDNPIQAITRTGIQTQNSHHECDVLIIATGFDAGTGAMSSIDITGRAGRTLREKWEAGPRTYLGIGVDEFPNMFMISGPQSSFANIPLVIDYAARWIGQAVVWMRETGIERMEPTTEAVNEWNEKLRAVLERPTIVARGSEVGSWLVGANIPGKPTTPLFHLGGMDTYVRDCASVARRGFVGFSTTPAKELTGS
jgi:cyclohexanone monooxygenase